METITEIDKQFRSAMLDAGLLYSGPIQADGRLHRIHIEGDSRGTRNGWFVLHGDTVPAGAFGSWKTGISGVWRAKTPMSWRDRAELGDRIQAAIKASNTEREARGIDAALRAKRIWDSCRAADPAHPYLVTKGIGAHGLRQKGEFLIVPIFGIEGAIMSLQHIGTDGEKRFLSGGRIRGGMSPIGDIDRSELVVCEGFATGATLHEITGKRVVVAFNAGNLAPVARVLRRHHPKSSIVFAADNDHETPGNPGLEKARSAARAAGAARVVAPPAEPGVTDWNDWFRIDGPKMLTQVLS